ncbi:MAG: hypothetical protein II525_00135 [Bacteroidales bacterium]|nr:hypothetical protein [Bacteroidales bacterium]
MTQKPRIHPYLLPCLACLLMLTACNPKGEISGTATYTDYYDGCTYPAAGATLHKVSILPNGTERNVSSVKAGDDGTFHFEYVEDGDWYIKATMNKEDVIYEGRSESFSVDRGGHAHTTCQLTFSKLVYGAKNISMPVAVTLEKHPN